jgi:nitrogenase iron protein NifH
MMNNPKHIAIYGEGGIGSTTTSNISAALVDAGYRVIQIGCDPKSDSTIFLRGGIDLPTVLDTVEEHTKVKIEDISAVGFKGVLCIESGGPLPGVGCAGRGINAVVNVLHQIRLFSEYKPDYVLYDLPGDVICGGFAMPIRNGHADRVYVVTSSDFMAIFAANNLFRAITKHAPFGGARLGGVIASALTAPYAESLVRDFVARTGNRVVGKAPRSLLVSQSELYGQTIIEAFPKSKEAETYRKLARFIAEDERTNIPKPFNSPDLKAWAHEWGDRIFNVEAGVIGESAGI